MTIDQPAPVNTTNINTAWAVLHAALNQRRTVRARYHDRLRVLSPHALGWKNGRPKTLVYQTAILDNPQTMTHAAGPPYSSTRSTKRPSATTTGRPPTPTPHTTGIDTLATAIT